MDAMMLIERLIKDGSGSERTPPTPPDILAHTLWETYQRYANGNPFKPGDLVTPRRCHGLKDEGAPHIVLNIFAPKSGEFEFRGSAGYVPDMRVLCENDGDIVPFFAESAFFEPWLGEVAKV